MSLSEELLKQANQYLENTLSDTDRSNFELQLLKNPELQDYISINKEMENQYANLGWQLIDENEKSKIIELENLLKSEDTKKLKSAISSAASHYNKNIEKRSFKSLKVYSLCAVAASFIILFGVYFLNKNQNLYNNYNSWQELPSLVERAESANSSLQNAEAEFRAKNYAKSKKLYQNYLDNNIDVNPTIYLYIGLSALELNEIDEALLNFDKLIESDALDFSKGYWYKALTYLKLEKKQEAIKQLNSIIKDKTNFNYKEAKKVLEQLEND